jgi:4-oxalomesaconate tautomerase
MRGGTSKGAVFRREDLPADPAARNALLLDLMGSPDPRQIDGLGGGDPLTSKAAILSASSRDDADVDYLFLQVFVDQARVSDAQACGNILAAVGPAAIELGLVPAQEGTTDLRIHMVNTGEIAQATVQTPGGKVSYAGDTTVDGVPGHHAPVALFFDNLAGSMTGALLPTGEPLTEVNGVRCTLIDNGMPCVVMRAADFGITGQESPAELEVDAALCARIEAIRLAAGSLMNLGDVTEKSVPKMVLASKPLGSGLVMTRSWIPHRVHKSLGVFAAVTVATAALTKGSAIAELAPAADPEQTHFSVEHPAGQAEVLLRRDADGNVTSCGLTRTARKIMEGRVFTK